MTSTDLTTTDQGGALDLPAIDTSSGALDALQRQAEAMAAAHKLGSVMSGTVMVPKHFQGKPDDCAAAILYGAELGLNAIQSLQNIMVINGKPGIEARTMVALVKQRGYRIETVESSDEKVTVRGTSPSGVTETSTWTIERAKKAGYTSNALYSKIPEQMLWAKAATEVCRKLAPDVLLGMPFSVEELRSQPVLEGTVVASERVDTPSRGTAGVRERLGLSSAEPAAREPEPVEQVASGPAINDLLALLGSVGIEGKEPVLEHLSRELGREVTTTRTLTVGEVERVIEAVIAQTEGGDR